MSGCTALVWRRESRGILGRGRESFATVPHTCGRPVVDGGELCRRHLNANAKFAAKLTAKRSRESKP